MLKENVAVITGANRGIGLSTVEVFAREHATIWACARQKSDEFEEKIKEISRKFGSNITPVYFDVAHPDEIKFSMKQIGTISKKIDILVNNAGVSVETFFNMTTPEVMQHTMNVNFLAQVQLAQIASRYMMKQKKGSIVNIASVSGIVSKQGGMAYGSSKAAVIFATKTMAQELGKYGIRVNSVSPGFIDTDMWINRDDAVRNEILAKTPLGRIGLPEEVAETILFLASDKSSYITSQNIIVDGGRMGGESRLDICISPETLTSLSLILNSENTKGE